ncbi:MAG: cyclic nucleotide-binding domain-containing protein [Myxococcota bacterium]
MTSKKLRKYLAYYQKTLREEPENIEARLRLASIFREMGRLGHAVEEYVNASKLLAREGLPLEAIAACKAVLELEPNHTETQMFLARLFAQVPDATGGTARVARPMESDDLQRRARPNNNGQTPSGPVEAQQDGPEDSQPITLEQPKKRGGASDALPPAGTAVDDETRRADPAQLPNFDDIEPPEEPEENEETRPAELAYTGMEQQTHEAEDDGSTVEMDAADRDEIARSLADHTPDEDLRATSNFDKEEIDAHRDKAGETSYDSTLRQVDAVDRDDDIDYYSDEFRSTQDVSEEDILGSEPAPPDEDLRTTQDVEEDAILGEEVVEEEDLRATNELKAPRRDTRQLGSVDRNRGRKMTSLGIPVSGQEVDEEETFEVGVFDMDSLGLENSSTDWDDLSFLDELEEPESGDVPADEYEVDTGEFGPAVLSVARSELPEIPLFSKLSPDLFAELLRVMDARTFDRGTAVVGEDTDKPSLWIIVSGEASVSKELEDASVVELARLGEGDFFGEFLLLTGRSGAATVSAATELSVLELREEVIEELARSNPKIWDVLWDFYYSRMLNNMLATSVIFRSLDRDERAELADEFSLEEVPADEQVLGQGEHDDDLYLICNGVIRVEHEDRDGQTREIDTLREGEFVGLISSAEETPVIANLKAVEDCTLLVLRGEVFRQVMSEYPAVQREVERAVRERKATAGRYTSGVTSYAQLGVASPPDNES